MSVWCADTSVVVPLVLTSHVRHQRVVRAVGTRDVQLVTHAQLESYSVLTRLPGDAKLTPDDAATLLSDRFGRPIVPPPELVTSLIPTLAAAGIAGGAVYDGLIGLAAMAVAAPLLTRDRRAMATYASLGVEVEFLGP